MTFNKNLKNIFLVVFATLILSACSTGKKSGNMDGDVYTGKETVKYLASGVPDRVFFATNKSSLTTAARETLIPLSCPEYPIIGWIFFREFIQLRLISWIGAG